ncbi:thioesterase II family protein [Catenulispora pinisilvae]|uniref:thioesterase II family protein n=1 Tax=Catenulispora pinisilvae TaxID=2705253 RepID=UPI001890F5D6|nr:alpha/beta fold hydrolase [Catenulispora pinisilvae]
MPGTDPAPTGWLRRFGPPGTPRLRLVCLPHAGGSASAYHGWRARLPDDIEVLAVCYPGRQDRIAEPFIEDMDVLARQIAGRLEPLSDLPLALFGHSMGSVLAFEVARLLEERGSGPKLLVLSGSSGPGGRDHDLPSDDEDEIIAFARKLGGTHAGLYEDRDLGPLLLPALRSDLRMARSYNHRPGMVEAPVLVCVGDRDPEVSVAEARLWSAVAAGEFEVEVFRGGHFYLVDREEELLADLWGRLRR